MHSHIIPLYSLWNMHNGHGGWNLGFTRHFNDWEMPLISSLLMKLEGYKVDQLRVYKPSWTLTKNQCFSVKSWYDHLVKERGEKIPIIWDTIASPQVAFFAWEAMWERVRTLDKVQRKGISLANQRYLCNKMEETANHFLLHSQKTRVLRSLLLGLFGLSWVLAESVKDTLYAWNTKAVKNHKQKAWQVAPLCLFWIVWKQQNKIEFQDGKLDKLSFVS